MASTEDQSRRTLAQFPGVHHGQDRLDNLFWDRDWEMMTGERGRLRPSLLSGQSAGCSCFVSSGDSPEVRQPPAVFVRTRG